MLVRHGGVWFSGSRQVVRVGGIMVAAGMLLCAVPGRSQDIHVAPVLTFFNANVRGWVSDPIIIQAIEAQNALNAHLTDTEIDALDQEGAAEAAAEGGDDRRNERPDRDQPLAPVGGGGNGGTEP